MNKQELINQIDEENNLPSEVGIVIKSLLEDYNLGYRELEIIKDWISSYLELDEDKKRELINEICVE